MVTFVTDCNGGCLCTCSQKLKRQDLQYNRYLNSEFSYPRLTMVYAGGALPNYMPPISIVLIRSKGDNLAARVDKRLSVLTINHLTSAFPSGFNFPHFVYDARLRKFKIRVFVSLDGLSSWTVKLHLLDPAGYEAPVARLRALLLQLRARRSCQRVYDTYTREAFYRQWDFVLTKFPSMTTFGK